jgi:hypothetical protein
VDGGELVSSPSSVSASFARSKAELSAMRTGAGPRPEISSATQPSVVLPTDSSSGAFVQSAGPTNTAAVLSTGVELTPHGSRRGLVIGVVAATVVLVAAAAVFVTAGGSFAANDAGAASTAETTTAATSTVASSSPAPTADTSGTTATATAEPTATTTAEPVASKEEPRVARPATPRPPRPKETAKPKTGPDDSLPSDYLPPEL